ncbi:MAG: hypothetical protein Tp166DCM644871_38 [Prokaryotic dsDNA virus sp.]|nr:MAG: hypothetical protein Tp166DCM644871_38 [Prokaryotic dsDNA virus sp.]QDP62638.1 MAG: hypothetical protein Tp166SUR375021_38 [Prokaryotic dsDNA virus sp.]|tara:strand:+ start:251 stop:622 length:372 start_codon:yes stop_codon:yes gene_type:complete
MQKIKGYYSLELGGKERTLHFSMNFWAALTEELGVSLQELDKVFGNEMALSSVRAIVYCGLLAYDQEEGNEISYNKFKVGSWLDTMTQDQFTEMIQALTESKILGNSMNAGIKRATEKKNQKK